jgi:hypothetical protein
LLVLVFNSLARVDNLGKDARRIFTFLDEILTACSKNDNLIHHSGMMIMIYRNEHARISQQQQSQQMENFTRV